jgi:hypothetical protein
MIFESQARKGLGIFDFSGYNITSVSKKIEVTGAYEKK